MSNDQPTTHYDRAKVYYITREDAQAKGMVRYFTGEPCKRGHVAERYVSNKGCIECNNWKVIKGVRAWNAVMPPSPMLFPSDMRPQWVTPELVSFVWAEVLKSIPALVDRGLARHNLERASTRTARLQPRLSAHAYILGWQSYQQMREAGNRDAVLYRDGLLVTPKLRDGSPDWLEWLDDGGSHQQAIENGMITEVPPA